MSMTGKGRRIHCVMRIASLFRRAMSAGVLVLVTLGVAAGEVPSAPMLRIETGHHTSFIQSLTNNESRQRLITVSDDKTIRVWQLPALEAVAAYRVPIAPGYEGQLYPAALSPDGRSLAGAGPSPIYRSGDQGRGRGERIAAAEARVSQSGGLPNGDVVYVAEDPAIAVLDPHSGRRRAYVGPEIADFRDGQRHFRVAHDGARVRIGYGRDTGRLGRYSLFDRELRSETRDDVALSPPLLKTQDVVVTYGEDGEHPSINDTVLQLDDYERLRSHASAPYHRHVLLGTEWAF